MNQVPKLLLVPYVKLDAIKVSEDLFHSYRPDLISLRLILMRCANIYGTYFSNCVVKMSRMVLLADSRSKYDRLLIVSIVIC